MPYLLTYVPITYVPKIRMIAPNIPQVILQHFVANCA